MEEKVGPAAQSDAIAELEIIGKPAVLPLIKQLKHPREHATVTRAAMALKTILKNASNQSSEALEGLIKLSQDAGYTAASEAVGLLGLFDDPRALGAIQEIALGHKDVYVRTAAIGALSIRKDKAKYHDLFKQLLNAESLEVACAAARTLSYSGDSSGFDIAMKGLLQGNKMSSARISATTTLANIGDARALPILRARYAEDPDGDIYNTIAIVEYKQLSTWDDRKLFLQKALRDDGGDVNRWAAMEIQKNLDAHPDFRELFEEAIRDPKHPSQNLAQWMLAGWEQNRKKP